MRLAQFAERHPYWFVAILEAAVVLVYLLVGTIAYFLGLSNMALYGLANLGLTLIVIVLLTRLKWWSTIGFKPLHRQGDLPHFFVLLVPMVLNLIPGLQIESVVYVSGALLIALMVGFAEETIFRGLMLQALKPLGHWRAAIITALLFGLTHAMNALTGKSMLESMVQIGYAVAIGFAYAALALKKDVLWLLILAHFLTDFVYFIQKPGFSLSPFWQSFLVISLTVGFTAYGIFMMQQKSRPHARSV
jgi:membrane protease YdiL (CAAX protease family)